MVSSLAYSLGWNAQGKRMGEMRQSIAQWQVQHLEMNGYVIMKKPPLIPHTAGGAPRHDYPKDADR